MDRSCSIPDCTNLHHARGWCNKHYALWRRWGTPEAHFRAELWHAAVIDWVLSPSVLHRLVGVFAQDMQVGEVIHIEPS